MNNLGELCTALYDAKKTEESAKAKRIEIEEQIASLVDTGINGSKTVEAGNGLKVTVKRGYIYVADIDAIRDLGDSLPAGVALPLKFTAPVPAGYEFDENAYEAMKDVAPNTFAQIARLVTTKPRKVAVTLKI